VTSVGRRRSQAKRSEVERDLELAQLSRRHPARLHVEEGEGGEEGRIEVVGRIRGWRAVQRHVEVGVKEGIRGDDTCEGRHTALAGDEEAQPGRRWPGRRVRRA
jgi:hypothetical protein